MATNEAQAQAQALALHAMYEGLRDKPDRARRLLFVILSYRDTPRRQVLQFLAPDEADMQLAIIQGSVYIISGCSTVLHFEPNNVLAASIQLRWQTIRRDLSLGITFLLGQSYLETLYECMQTIVSIREWKLTGVLSEASIQ